MTLVLVGYDDHPAAERALARAIDEARERKARLVVLAVEEMPLDPEGPQSFGTLDDTPAQMLPLVAPPHLQAVLDKAQATVEAAGSRAEYVWAAGDPAASIVGIAHDRHADLVVLGEHHHSMFGRLFGADVAADVEERLGGRVLVVS